MSTEEWQVHYPDNFKDNRCFDHAVVFPSEAKARAESKRLEAKFPNDSFPVSPFTEEREDAGNDNATEHHAAGTGNREGVGEFMDGLRGRLRPGLSDNAVSDLAPIAPTSAEGEEQFDYFKCPKCGEWSFEDEIATPSPASDVEKLVARLHEHAWQLAICDEACALLERQAAEIRTLRNYGVSAQEQLEQKDAEIAGETAIASGWFKRWKAAQEDLSRLRALTAPECDLADQLREAQDREGRYRAVVDEGSEIIARLERDYAIEHALYDGRPVEAWCNKVKALEEREDEDVAGLVATLRECTRRETLKYDPYALCWTAASLLEKLAGEKKRAWDCCEDYLRLAWERRVALKEKDAEIEALKHDLTRHMDIANEYLNLAERYRAALEKIADEQSWPTSEYARAALGESR